MPDDKEYFGLATKTDGTHIHLSKDEAAAIWEACEKAKEARQNDMPTTDEALSTLSSAKERLRELGWSNAIYCPKDGSDFAVIQYGSAGIFYANYQGEWPTGSLYCCDFFNHPEGAMWKALEDLTEAEKTKLKECTEMDRQMADRELAAIAALDDCE